MGHWESKQRQANTKKIIERTITRKTIEESIGKASRGKQNQRKSFRTAWEDTSLAVATQGRCNDDNVDGDVDDKVDYDDPECRKHFFPDYTC